MLSVSNLQMVVLQPQGQLDLNGGKALKDQMGNLLTQPFRVWVIDLEKVDFLDSFGLAALVPGLLAARQSGCRLILCNIQPSVRMVFELTQVNSVLEFFENKEALLASVNAVRGKEYSFASVSDEDSLTLLCSRTETPTTLRSCTVNL